MIDAILRVADFSALVSHLDANYPDMLERDESGHITQPPVVRGFDRTPAVVNDNALMVYARLRSNEMEQWRGMPHVRVLAETPYNGTGTARRLIDIIESDPALLAAYESVSPRDPVTRTDPEIGEYTTRPPRIFGIMAGAGGRLGWDD